MRILIKIILSAVINNIRTVEEERAFRSSSTVFLQISYLTDSFLYFRGDTPLCLLNSLIKCDTEA